MFEYLLVQKCVNRKFVLARQIFFYRYRISHQISVTCSTRFGARLEHIAVLFSARPEITTRGMCNNATGIGNVSRCTVAQFCGEVDRPRVSLGKTSTRAFKECRRPIKTNRDRNNNLTFPADSFRNSNWRVIKTYSKTRLSSCLGD